MSSQMRRKGDRGEEMAADFLRRQGYGILERNYLVRNGEIDLVAEKNGVLSFVEVKTRHSHRFGLPLEAITPAKTERFFAAIFVYLERKNVPEDIPWQADVITVDWNEGFPRIEHYENAFLSGVS